MSNTYKVFDKTSYDVDRQWICPNHITAALLDRAFGSCKECLVTPQQQMIVKCGDEAVDLIKIVSISISNTYRIFDNLHLHMTWMRIWMCPNHIMAAQIQQVFWNSSRFWVTPQQQMIAKCCGACDKDLMGHGPGYDVTTSPRVKLHGTHPHLKAPQGVQVQGASTSQEPQIILANLTVTTVSFLRYPEKKLRYLSHSKILFRNIFVIC